MMLIINTESGSDFIDPQFLLSLTPGSSSNSSRNWRTMWQEVDSRYIHILIFSTEAWIHDILKTKRELRRRWLTENLDGFNRWFQDDEDSVRKKKKKDRKKENDYWVSRIQTWCSGPCSDRNVVPLPRQVFWLRWVGHPGRAAVRGGWRHDEVVGVSRSVGGDGVDGCDWVSCGSGTQMMTWLDLPDWSLSSTFLTWEVVDGLVHSYSGEGSPRHGQVGGAVVLLDLDIWGFGHAWLEANVRSGSVD